MRNARGLSLCLALGLVGAAHGQELETATPDFRYLLGLRLSHGPVYFGQKRGEAGLQPVLALHWGRLRISNSGGGSLLGERGSGGASTDLISTEQWNLALGLRLDRGRHLSTGLAHLDELPNVRGTLRGRVALTWHRSQQTDWTVAGTTDLLDRGAGQTLQLTAAHRLGELDRYSPIGGRWTAYASLHAGSGRYLRSHFGVPAGLSLPAYTPGAGLRNLGLGLGWQRELGRHWLVFGGVSVAQLLGPAARSPFVERRLTAAGDIGFAYRR